MKATAHGLIATSVRTARPCRTQMPATVAELVSILAQEPDAVVVAGGTDLCAQFNEGLQPGLMVGLARLAELSVIEADDRELRIGAAVTHAAGSSHPLVGERLPGFANAWSRIANVRVRFWATIGGNLMARRTRYEASILLQALDARLRFLGPDGMTELAPGDIWRAPAPPRGLLHHIAIPLGGDRGFVYDRTLRPTVTVAVATGGGTGRAVLATDILAPVMLPFAFAGHDPARAAEDALAGLPPSFHDAASSHWYLRAVGTVLVRRALEALAHG